MKLNIITEKNNLLLLSKLKTTFKFQENVY